MAYDLSKVVVTSSPHIKADDDTRSLMLDVLIALVPALAVAIYLRRPRTHPCHHCDGVLRRI